MRLNLSIHDVKGDGHCFFRAVAHSLLNHRSRSLDDAEDLTRGLRRTISTLARTRHREKVQSMIERAIETCIQPRVDCFLSNTTFDLVKFCGENEVHRDYTREYSDALSSSNSFASFVEVELMQLLMKRHGIVIYIAPSIESLNSGLDWRKRMRKLSKYRESKNVRLMTLLNSDGVHYLWVSIGGQSLPLIKDLFLNS